MSPFGMRLPTPAPRREAMSGLYATVLAGSLQPLPGERLR